MPPTRPAVDTVVIGSGFGAALAARSLVAAGERVVMIERGDWVRRGPAAWRPQATATLTGAYDPDTAYEVHGHGRERVLRALTCVGGASVFYGGVSLRLRTADLTPAPVIAEPSGVAWPLRYSDLAPWYDEAERLLDVAGTAGADPTEPPRAIPYPQVPAPAHPITARLAAAAAELGLTPSPSRWP